MSYKLKSDQGVILADLLAGQVTLMADQLRYSLRIKSQDRTAFTKACGIDLPNKIGQTIIQNDRMVFCVGPDEYILIDNPNLRETLKQKFEQLADKFVFSTTDISHRNIGFKLSGKQAARMINIGCPLDLSLETFPVGKCTRSVFESAEILIFRNKEDEFQLETWRSFAPYMARYFEKFCLENESL